MRFHGAFAFWFGCSFIILKLCFELCGQILVLSIVTGPVMDAGKEEGVRNEESIKQGAECTTTSLQKRQKPQVQYFYLHITLHPFVLSAKESLPLFETKLSCRKQIFIIFLFLYLSSMFLLFCVLSLFSVVLFWTVGGSLLCLQCRFVFFILD